MADEGAERYGDVPKSTASDLATGRDPVEWEKYMQEVLTRLQVVEESGGGAGGSADVVESSLAYMHTQTVPSDTWTISHNFYTDHSQETYPLVNVVGPDGHQLIAEVAYPDFDTVVISFAGPMTGVAYLRG